MTLIDTTQLNALLMQLLEKVAENGQDIAEIKAQLKREKL
jgi:hypothetical protein